MVEICSKHNTRIFLVSNGVLLREKHQHILKDPIFRQICFSYIPIQIILVSVIHQYIYNVFLSSPIWYFKNVRNSILILDCGIYRMFEVAPPVILICFKRFLSTTNNHLMWSILMYEEENPYVLQVDCICILIQNFMAFSRYSHSSRERNMLWTAISFWHFS